VGIGKEQQPHPVNLQYTSPLTSLTAGLGSGLADIDGVIGTRRTDVGAVVIAFARA
jgi:hypothetical protein